MQEPPEHHDFDETAARLRQDPEALDWPIRRQLAVAVAERLASDGPSEPALALLILLARDPKWEVRAEVAGCLLRVPEDRFPHFAAALVQDPNAFVRQAVERAMDRRRRGRETARRKQRGLEQVEDQYAQMEKVHGAVAAEKARQLAERFYDVLVGATVHDMRNILAPMISAVECLLGHLEDGNLDPQRFRRNLIRMDQQAKTLERMLEDMRAYAQPTPAQRRRERLAEIVREAHAFVLDTFRATGLDCSSVTILIEVPEHLTLDVSRHQIVRAVANLIKNAYEAFAIAPQTFAPGQIQVAAKAVDRDRVELVITDTGMGFSPEDLADVRRFVPGGTSKKTYGTGFGLPIAYRKIKDHGGSLGIQSVEDRGTTVTVTLPTEAGGEA